MAEVELSADDLYVDSNENQCGNVVSQNINSPSSGSDELEKDFCSHETEEQISGNSVAFKNLDCSDPALWPSVLSDDHRKLFVEKGPCRISFEYPTDENGRRFLERYYDRYLANGEKVNRVWLVYSPSTDSVFCFCCKLFRSNEKMALITDGLRDLRNMKFPRNI